MTPDEVEDRSHWSRLGSHCRWARVRAVRGEAIAFADPTAQNAAIRSALDGEMASVCSDILRDVSWCGCESDGGLRKVKSESRSDFLALDFK